ncbi:MAG: alpha/beta fold hydrolase [Alphaproteobacteria bacterium]
MSHFLRTFTVSTVLAIASTMQATADTAAINDQTVTVGDQTFRYLSAGTSGTPIVLIHGWPQSADEFRPIMPDLAANHMVYAVDISGVGGSTAPGQDWSKQALAGDIKEFADALGIEDPIVAGHDIGGMVAYAYAREFADETSGVIIMDIPIPGLAPWDWVVTSPLTWHFDFHAQEGLVEQLVAGHQAEYFRYFVNLSAKYPDAISEESIATYAAAYTAPQSLSAGFELYRSFAEDTAFFLSKNEPFDMPVLVVGAETTMAQSLDMLADDLRKLGATNVETLEIVDSGHWISEEQPAATIAAIAGFAEDVSSQ